jgi:hypothetical protein
MRPKEQSQLPYLGYYPLFIVCFRSLLCDLFDGKQTLLLDKKERNHAKQNHAPFR